MAELIRFIADWIISFLGGFGLWGIFFALVLESTGIPFTSEAFLLFGGFLVARGQLSLSGVVAAGIAGYVVGSFIPYFLGRYHGNTILGVGGRFFLASEAELDRVEAWFDAYGQGAVLFGRLIPVVRNVISLPAGHGRMPLPRFMLYTGLGSSIWIGIVTYLGVVMESEWPVILSIIERWNRLILVAIGGGLAFLIVRRFVVKGQARG